VKRLIFVLAFSLLVGASARADGIPSLVSGPIADGSNFDFNYMLSFSASERLDPTATSGVACPGLGGKLVQCNPAGTFVTIYDIQGFVSASAGASGFVTSMQLNGLTPSTINGASIDDPTLVNVTFMYTGPVVLGPVDVTGFQIISSLNGIQNGVFTSQTTNDLPGGSNGTTIQTVGSVSVPSGPGPTPAPEPASILLLGAGLIGIGATARRKTRP
jgi:PEP-CTERM motif-containing protein